jgi:hypothetical protein
MRPPRPVDGVEGASPHDHSTGGRAVPLQNAPVDGVVAVERPGVKAVGVPKAVLGVRTGGRSRSRRARW